ncbi:MAG TPA: protein-tyrosine phosphatase family protein [Tepidisphaeraceae bacterium]|nr:protein-tyrosine phosphatase family protein [Tepidisphaeraceae bacterium]
MAPRIFNIEIPAGRIAITAAPRGIDDLTDQIAPLRKLGVHVMVSLLTDPECAELGVAAEGSVCESVGIGFLRFPIADHDVPGDRRQFRQFVSEIVARLKKGSFILIHCRAGIGRSSLVAACVMGAIGIDPATAFRQITLARGCSVPDTTEQLSWTRQFVAWLQAQ